MDDPGDGGKLDILSNMTERHVANGNSIKNGMEAYHSLNKRNQRVSYCNEFDGNSKASMHIHPGNTNVPNIDLLIKTAVKTSESEMTYGKTRMDSKLHA